jgi:hypothetical protein
MAASLARRMTLRVYPYCANQVMEEPAMFAAHTNWVYKSRDADDLRRATIRRVISVMPLIISDDYRSQVLQAIAPLICTAVSTVYVLYGPARKRAVDR